MKLDTGQGTDAGRGASEWSVLRALIVTMIVNQTGVVIISPLVVDIAEAFNVAVSAAAQLRTASALVSAVLAPFVGIASERLGSRPLIIGGLFGVGLAGLGSALAPTFGVLLAVQAAGGLGIAALLSMGYAAVGDYFPAGRRAWAIGMVTIGQPLAWVVGLPLIGFLADTFSWRASFLGVPMAFSLVGLAFALRLPAPRRAAEREPGTRRGHGGALGSLIRDRSAVIWVIAELSAYTGWAGTLTFLGAFYVVVINVLGGAKSIDVRYFQSAYSMGASKWDVFRRIILPGTLPSICIGSAVGMGITWEVVVAAEMISGGGGAIQSSAGGGLGFFIWNSYIGFSYEQIVVGMISIGIAGYLSSAFIRKIGFLFTPWLRVR